MNLKIMETTISMLHHAELPLIFWAEAVSTAVHLRNRSPTSYLKEMTPYKRWHGSKADVNNLKVFGCNAYVHVPDQKRKKQDKSVQSIFVGYPNNSKGYKSYSPDIKRMFRSRDVIFLENSFGSKHPDCEIKLQDQELIDGMQSKPPDVVYFDKNPIEDAVEETVIPR